MSRKQSQNDALCNISESVFKVEVALESLNRALNWDLCDRHNVHKIGQHIRGIRKELKALENKINDKK